MDELRAHAIVRVDHLLAIEPYQSTEETRFYLNGVYIEPHWDGARMVATDGHTLLAIYDAEAYAEALPAIWAVGRKALTKIKASIKDWEAAGGSWNKQAGQPYWVQLRFDRAGDAEMGVYCAATSKEVLGDDTSARHLVASFQDRSLKVEGPFPEWRRVTPAFPSKDGKDKDGKLVVPEALDPRYLKRVADTAKLLGSKGLKVCPTSKDGPCRVVFEDHPEVLGVVMPRRAPGAPAEDPAWLDWSLEAEEAAAKAAAA